MNIPHRQNIAGRNIRELHDDMASCGFRELLCAPWKEKFPSDASAKVCALSDGETLALRFDVVDEEVLATCAQDNQPVCRDSCVEFFVEPQPGGGYFNFEFSCIGVCLGEWGGGRENRKKIPSEQLKSIERFSTLGNAPFESRPAAGSCVEWEMTVKLPLRLIADTDGSSIVGWRANIYKCGDGLRRPHYLSLFPIEAPQPDFHRPESFGKIEFE